MIKEFRNFTGILPIVVLDSNGGSIEFPVFGSIDINYQRERLGTFSGVNFAAGCERIDAVPEPEEGVVFIVNEAVATHSSLSHRQDLAYPGEAADPAGLVHPKNAIRYLVACPGLAQRLAEQLAAGPTGSVEGGDA